MTSSQRLSEKNVNTKFQELRRGHTPWLRQINQDAKDALGRNNNYRKENWTKIIPVSKDAKWNRKNDETQLHANISLQISTNQKPYTWVL